MIKRNNAKTFIISIMICLFQSQLFAEQSFKTIPLGQSWQSITDNDARGQGSQSKVMQLTPSTMELYKTQLILGQRDGTVSGGKVGFSRIFQSFSAQDLTEYEGIWIPLALSNTSIKISIIIDDQRTDNISYRSDIQHRYSDKERLGLMRSGGIWVSFSEFTGNRRGTETQDQPDLSKISYLGIQLTRSIQDDELFSNTESISQVVSLWSNVIALKKASKILNNLEFNPDEKISQITLNSKRKAISTFSEEDFEKLDQLVQNTASGANLPLDAEGEFLRRTILPRILNSDIALRSGGGPFLPSPRQTPGGTYELRLSMLSKLQSISQLPGITSKWLKSFYYELASEAGEFNSNELEKITFKSEDIEKYLEKRINECKLNVRVKSDVITRTNGSIGLSRELIALLSSTQGGFVNNVFFDFSEFSEIVGPYSFALMFLFYSDLINPKPCGDYETNELPLMSKYYNVTVSNGEGNAAEGWRLWQRIFGGTGNNLFVDPTFWKKYIIFSE